MTRTGADYLADLRDRRKVIYEGRPIEDVVDDPLFGRTARAIACFYDFQNAEPWRELMTTVVEDGERIGTAFIEPRTKQELRQVARAYAAWAEVSSGFMGRSPDYMNTCLSALGTASKGLEEADAPSAKRAREIYLRARREDLCYTHTFAEPYKVLPSRDHVPSPPCRVVKESDDGLVIRGARGLATLAPFSDMNFDLFGGVAYERKQQSMVLGFVVPADAKGLQWICRPTYQSEHGPLSSRWDEMDCVAIFDDCLIPWDDVYVAIPDGIAVPSARFFMIGLQHHVLVRAVAKTRFLIGLAHLIAESSRVNQFVNIRERIGEMVCTLRTMEAFAVAAVETAVTDPSSGRLYPNPETVQTAVTVFGDLHSRMLMHIKDIGGSRHTSAPHAATLDAIGLAFEDHFKGASSSAHGNISLFRLAWDVAGSTWGARQELYERFHFGDAVLRRAGTYMDYDLSEAVAMVERALEPGSFWGRS
jgi:aromatic ring hydroxylase